MRDGPAADIAPALSRAITDQTAAVVCERADAVSGASRHALVSEGAVLGACSLQGLRPVWQRPQARKPFLAAARAATPRGCLSPHIIDAHAHALAWLDSQRG